MKQPVLKKQPNIVLAMCDQMRGDCMGVAGHPDVKTPYLDSLAGEGTYFPNARAACPSCIPSRAALFTGMSQERHKRVGYEDGIAWDYPHMMPEVFARHGYHTEAVGKLHVHPPLRRCGFHNLALHDGYIGYYRKPGIPARQQQAWSDSYIRWLRERHGMDADVNDTGLECNSFLAKAWVYDEMSHPTNWAVTESIRFLEKRDPDVPFFLMTSFVRPHPPFDAPADYFRMYGEALLREPVMGDWERRDMACGYAYQYDSPFGTEDKRLQRLAMEGYYACITHMDHQIGRLLQALYREELLEDTVIVFLSDHGELLFDHGMFRKVQPYEGSVRIPCIVRVGKNLTDQKQVPVCRDLVELRDIMPTLLSAAGIPVPEGADGQSFLPSLFGCPGFSREYLHGEHSAALLSNHFIVTEEDKYIWYSQTGEEHYFCLRSDPGETRDLIRDPAAQERIAYLRGLLMESLRGREEGYTDGKRLIAGKPPVNILRDGWQEDAKEVGGTTWNIQ